MGVQWEEQTLQSFVRSKTSLREVQGSSKRPANLDPLHHQPKYSFVHRNPRSKKQITLSKPIIVTEDNGCSERDNNNNNNMEEEPDMVMAAYKSMAVDSTTSSFDFSPTPFDQDGGRKNARMDKNGGMGEIIQVEGGQIVRSTGKKDRHSKVVTAKGLRDRRVRLSALTAIHFYDVQDRLGCDRPSKAVDWLLQKAQPSIDKLPKKNPNQNNNSITISSPPKRIKSQYPTPQPAITPSQQQIHQEIPHEQNQYVPGQYPPQHPSTIMSTFQIPDAMMNMPFQNPNVLCQYLSSMYYQQNQSYTDNTLPPGSIPGGGDSNGNTRQDQVLGNMFCRSSSSSMVPPSAFTEEGNRHSFKWYNNASSDTDNYDDDDNIKNNADANAYEIQCRALAQQAQQPHPSSFRGGHGGFHSTTTKETLQSSSALAFLADPNHHNVDLIAANYNNNTNNSYSYGFCGFRIPARIQGIEEDEHHEKTKHPSSASSSSQHHRFS